MNGFTTLRWKNGPVFQLVYLYLGGIRIITKHHKSSESLSLPMLILLDLLSDNFWAYKPYMKLSCVFRLAKLLW